MHDRNTTIQTTHAWEFRQATQGKKTEIVHYNLYYHAE